MRRLALCTALLLAAAFGRAQGPSSALFTGHVQNGIPVVTGFSYGVPIFGPSGLRDDGSQLTYHGSPVQGGVSPAGTSLQNMTVRKTQGGVVWQTDTGAFTSQFVNMFGDSITRGQGLPGEGSPPPTGSTQIYSRRVIAAVGGGSFATALDGDQSMDTVNKVYATLDPHLGDGTTSTTMIGTNDNSCPTAADHCANYFAAYLSAAAWGSIPFEYKLQGNSPGCVKTGTWSTTLYGHNSVASSSNVGDKIVCTTFDSAMPALYVAWRAFQNGSTSATLNIDGANVDTLTEGGFAGTNVVTFNQPTGANTSFAKRYALGSAGPHTVTITVASYDGTNPFTFQWMGAPDPAPSLYGNSGNNPPRFLVAGPPCLQVVSGSPSTTGCNDPNGKIVYQQAQLVSSTLLGDGAYVPFVDVRAYQNDSIDMQSGTSGQTFTLPSGKIITLSSSPPQHPNSQGYEHIANAFLSVLQPHYAPSNGTATNPFTIGPQAPTTTTPVIVDVTGFNTINQYNMFNINSGNNANQLNPGICFTCSTGAKNYEFITSGISQLMTSGIKFALQFGATNGYAFGFCNLPSTTPSTQVACVPHTLLTLSENYQDVPTLSPYGLTTVPSAITAAATIAPVNGIFHVTGATAVSTITPPSGAGSGAGMTIDFVADTVGFSMTTGGNIATPIAATTTAGTPFHGVYDGSNWYIK